MIDKTTSRVIMGLLGTACVLITAFAWYKTKYAAVPEAGMHHNIYDEDIPRSAPVPVDYRMVLLTPQELAKAPLADVFTSPLGDENGAFTYVALRNASFSNAFSKIFAPGSSETWDARI